MQKTIVVQISRRVPHPLYKRIVTKHKKFYAHDEEGTARLGDIVTASVKEAADLLDLTLLDHVIVGSAGDYASIRSQRPSIWQDAN